MLRGNLRWDGPRRGQVRVTEPFTRVLGPEVTPRTGSSHRNRSCRVPMAQQTMSAVTAAASPSAVSELSNTQLLHRFLVAFLLTVASFVAAGAAWGSQAANLLVVGLGWPHVLLGSLFYFNKVLKGEDSHRTHFAGLLAITLAISLVHHWQPITTFIFLYFVYHAFRDEISIYHLRRTHHRFAGPQWRPGLVLFLLGTTALAGLAQMTYPRVLRHAEVPADQLVSGQPVTFTFAPIEDSAGRDYHFRVWAPRSQPPVKTLRLPADNYPAGEIRVDGRRGELEGDLVFTPIYAGAGALPTAALSGSVPQVINSGPRLGQTFRVEADGLSGITLPVVVEGAPPPGAKVRLEVEPAFFVRYPYAFESGLVAVAVALVALLMVGVPQRVFQTRPGLRYAIPVLLLFSLVLLAVKYSRVQGLVSMPFLAFLVVFHYFSWYVFSLEKIALRRSLPDSRPAMATANPVPTRMTLLDRLLKRMSTQRGFLAAVIALNAVSFAGAYAWQVQQVHPALAYLFSFHAFLYPLIFHVTMSFAPKGPPKPRPA